MSLPAHRGTRPCGVGPGSRVSVLMKAKVRYRVCQRPKRSGWFEPRKKRERSLWDRFERCLDQHTDRRQAGSGRQVQARRGGGRVGDERAVWTRDGHLVVAPPLVVDPPAALFPPRRA